MTISKIDSAYFILTSFESVKAIRAIYEYHATKSHLQFELLVSYASLPVPTKALQYAGFTYVALKKDVSRVAFTEKLNESRHKTISYEPELWPKDPFILEPVNQVYFNKQMVPEYLSLVVKTRDKNTLYLYLGMSILIVAAAIINFLVCFFSKFLHEAKPLALKRIFGISENTVLLFLTLDAVFILGTSFVIALTISVIVLPTFNQWTDSSLGLHNLFDITLLLSTVCAIIVAASALSLITKQILSFNKLYDVLNNKTFFGRSSSRVLTATLSFQILFATTILICNNIISNQTDFLFNEPIGFNRANLIEVDLSGVPQSFAAKTIKNEMLSIPQVTDASICVGGPLTGRWERDFEYNGQVANVGFYQVDRDFVSTLRIDIIQGQSFPPDLSPDSSYLLMNESAAQFFRVDKNFDTLRNDLPFAGKILGITKNFHYSSFKSKVSPTFIIYTDFNSAGSQKGKLIIRTIDLKDFTLQAVKAKWNEVFNGVAFEYSIISDEYESQYSPYKNESKLLKLASASVLFITCLGMIGITYFVSLKRMKEVAVKKILGGSLYDISKGWIAFLISTTVVSMVLGLFFASKLTNPWLDNFLYKGNLSVASLIMTYFVLLFCLATASLYNILKVVTMSPATVLREN